MNIKLFLLKDKLTKSNAKFSLITVIFTQFIFRIVNQYFNFLGIRDILKLIINNYYF